MLKSAKVPNADTEIKKWRLCQSLILLTYINAIFHPFKKNVKMLPLYQREEVYQGLRRVVGPGKISKFIQELVRPHVVRPNLEGDYAEMAQDLRREAQAMEWAERTFKDIGHETA